MNLPPRNALMDRAGGATPVLVLGEGARTADQEALGRAREMAEQGADPAEIWRSTGWFQGPDRGWRFEIDDRQFGLTPDAQRDVTDGTPIRARPLSEVYEHEGLFAGYPLMRDMPVTIERRPGRDYRGEYDPGGDGIAIYEPNEPNQPDLLRRIGAHEIQHGIDAQMAGFDYGIAESPPGEVGDLRDIARTHFRDDPLLTARQRRWRLLYSRSRRERPAPESPLWAAEVRLPGLIEARTKRLMYERQTGEEMARAVERRLHLTPEERRERPPWLDFAVPPRNHLLEAISGFDKGGRPLFAE
jgi:hypothetical protein